MVGLQLADGTWQLSPVVAVIFFFSSFFFLLSNVHYLILPFFRLPMIWTPQAALGRTEEDIISQCGTFQYDIREWTTALVLSWLRTQIPQHDDRYQLVMKKAHDYLTAANPGLLLSANALSKMAVIKLCRVMFSFLAICSSPLRTGFGSRRVTVPRSSPRNLRFTTFICLTSLSQYRRFWFISAI